MKPHHPEPPYRPHEEVSRHNRDGTRQDCRDQSPGGELSYTSIVEAEPDHIEPGRPDREMLRQGGEPAALEGTGRGKGGRGAVGMNRPARLRREGIVFGDGSRRERFEALGGRFHGM